MQRSYRKQSIIFYVSCCTACTICLHRRYRNSVLVRWKNELIKTTVNIVNIRNLQLRCTYQVLRRSLPERSVALKYTKSKCLNQQSFRRNTFPRGSLASRALTHCFKGGGAASATTFVILLISFNCPFHLFTFTRKLSRLRMRASIRQSLLTIDQWASMAPLS